MEMPGTRQSSWLNTVGHTILPQTPTCPQKPASCTQAGPTQHRLACPLPNLPMFLYHRIFPIKRPHSPTAACSHACWSFGDVPMLTCFLLSAIDFSNCCDKKLSSPWKTHPLHCYLHIFFHICLTGWCVYYNLTGYYILLPEWLCFFLLLN